MATGACSAFVIRHSSFFRHSSFGLRHLPGSASDLGQASPAVGDEFLELDPPRTAVDQLGCELPAFAHRPCPARDEERGSGVEQYGVALGPALFAAQQAADDFGVIRAAAAS